MKNLRILFIMSLLFLSSCAEKEEKQAFQEQDEEDCGCDEVDTTSIEN